MKTALSVGWLVELGHRGPRVAVKVMAGRPDVPFVLCDRAGKPPMILDGVHCLIKAVLLGRTTIVASVFTLDLVPRIQPGRIFRVKAAGLHPAPSAHPGLTIPTAERQNGRPG
jgi:hypothetical protein